MPSYRGHLIGGVITYVILLQVVKYAHPNIHVVIQGFACCLLGSLFPDVDIKSKGQQIFYKLLFVFLLYCTVMHKWWMFIGSSFIGVIPLLVRHRGLFHQVWFLLFVTLSLTIALKSLHKPYEMILLANTWFFFAGSLSHILLDRTLTKMKRY